MSLKLSSSVRSRLTPLQHLLDGVCCRRWMSVRPEEQAPASPQTSRGRKKITIQRLSLLRSQAIPISMLTAYDYPSGRRTEVNDIDVCLVGDSLAQTALGYDSTTRLTLDEMLHHCKAVGRGAKSPLLVADMPFGTYHAGTRDAIRNAVRLIQEGGMEAVKLEGGEEIVPTVNALTQMGIPVMAHIGLLPQRHAFLSGYRVQGRSATAAVSLLKSSLALQEAGAFSIVLEAVPFQLAKHITEHLTIPTIGIGAGPFCSGQVLVQDDALGVWNGHKAKFVRRFADLGSTGDAGVRAYNQAVKEGAFPNSEESYEMEDIEWEKFLQLQPSTLPAPQSLFESGD